MKAIGDTNPEMIKGVEMDNDPWRLSDIISGIVATKEADRLSLLEISDLKKKIKKLLFIIDEEISIIKLQKKIGKTVKDKADKSQKEYFLREQIKAIQEELGEDDEESEISKLEEQIQNRNLPKEVKEKALYEVKRLKSMSSNSSESNVTKTYIEWILDIPWEISTEENIDINFAEEIINRDHFGLKDVKDRIIEFLAVKQISGNMIRAYIMSCWTPWSW